MTNALKQAQKDDKHLMQALHDACRFDFCKPYIVTKVDGKYTENKIRKIMKETLVDGKPITNVDHKIVILTRDENRCYYNYWHLVEILGTRIKIDTNCRGRYFSLHNFYTQSRFHEVRKSDTCETIIIAQHYSNLCSKKTYAFDMYKRMYLLEVNRNRTWDTDREYIGSLVVRGENGDKETLYTHNEPKTLDEVIDKSGYMLDIRHADMRRRLKENKANMMKAVADNTDFSEHLANLTTLVESKKIVLMETFKNCNTYAEYKKFEEAFAYYGGFMNIVENYEQYRKSVNEKLFSSVEEENRFYHNIMNKLMA